MQIPGLHHQIAAKRAAAGELARSARRPACDARISCEKNAEAERLAIAADELAAHAKGNDEVMEGILHLIHYLAKSPHQSRYRTLAITALEESHLWLFRENGTEATTAKLAVLPQIPATNGKKKL